MVVLFKWRKTAKYMLKTARRSSLASERLSHNDRHQLIRNHNTIDVIYNSTDSQKYTTNPALLKSWMHSATKTEIWWRWRLLLFYLGKHWL